MLGDSIHMRFLLLALLTLDSAFGADPEAIMKKVGALVVSANQAAASNRNSEAEEDYKEAVVQCDLVPPGQYYCKTNVLRNLGDFYSRIKDNVKSEEVRKERLEILLAHRKVGGPLDLEIGDALFELQGMTFRKSE